MSTSLIQITNALPDYLKEMAYVDEGLADGIAIRSPKLSVSTAKEFTITKAGKQQIMEQRTMRCVIVAASQTLTKAWYEKAYAPGSTEAPDCFSNDGKVPAAGVAKPQSSNCASCPKNAFGSHPVTGRGKACGDRKLIVLVWEGDPETLMTFNAPTMTLSNLAKLNSELKSANVPLQSVLIELSFDPGVTYPVVKLNAVGFVDKGTLQRLKALSESDEVKQMLREVDYEPATEAAPVVPQNTIAFGSATAGGTVEPSVEAAANVDPAAAQVAALQAQLAALQNKPTGPTPEELAAQQLKELQAQLAAKREAERKAQEEAARKAATKPKTEAELLQEQIAALQAQLSSAAAKPEGDAQNQMNLLQSISASTQQSAPAEPGKRKRRTKAEMEAARAAAAAGGPAVDETPEEQADAAAAQTPEPAVLTGTVETADTGAAETPSGMPDVLSLLAKWKN